jgi:hypothetical protein
MYMLRIAVFPLSGFNSISRCQAEGRNDVSAGLGWAQAGEAEFAKIWHRKQACYGIHGGMRTEVAYLSLVWR